MEPVGNRSPRPPDRRLRPAYPDASRSRAQTGARRRGLEGGRRGARRARDRADEIQVARRSGVLGCRFERRLGALSRAESRSREVAAGAGMAQCLLGAPGRQARTRNAGIVITRGIGERSPVSNESRATNHGVYSMLIVDAQVHLWAANTPERPWPEAEKAGVPIMVLATHPDLH